MIRKYSVGVDIGGSHITSALIDLESATILRETVSEMPVDNKAESDIILRQWAQAIARSISFAGEEEIRGVGFAMPGPFNYVNGICLIKGVPKYEKLYGINVGEALAKELGVEGAMDFRFINDASSFAVGEAWAGKARNTERSMAITLGTGFGSAFVANNVPVVTGDTVPELGCVYHIKVGSGIADDYFSTRWFQNRYKEIRGIEVSGVKDIAEAAMADNKLKKEIFDHFGTSLGKFLAPWLMRFGAEVLVIGGNISRAFNLFGESLVTALSAEGCKSVVEVSELKEDAALLGSAYLLDDKFWNKVKDSLQYM